MTKVSFTYFVPDLLVRCFKILRDVTPVRRAMRKKAVILEVVLDMLSGGWMRMHCRGFYLSKEGKLDQ